MAEGLLKGLLRATVRKDAPVARRRVLNVGGNSKAIAMPDIYAGWDQLWLDIDPAVQPDLLCDARKLTDTPAAAYDAVYCSHNLEHYFRHDAYRVLRGFQHVLKPGGFAHIRVPDIAAVMRTVVERGLDIDDFLYQSPGGPITPHDVLYGWGQEIERSGNDFFAHKMGFTEKSLNQMLHDSGFKWVYQGAGNLELMAYAFVDKPDDFAVELLDLPRDA